MKFCMKTFENYPNSKKIDIVRGNLIDKLRNVMLPEIKYHPREKLLHKRFNIDSPTRIITEDRDNMLYLYVGIEGELGYIGNVDAKGNFEYVSRLAAGRILGYRAVKKKYPLVSNFLSANYGKVMNQEKIDAFNKNPNQWLEIKSAETFEAEGMMLWKGKSIPISEFDYSKVPNGWTVDEYSEYGDYTNEELVILLDNPSKSPQTVITDIEDYDKRDCPRHKYGMGSHFTKRNNGVRRYIMDGCECIIYDNSTMKSRKKRVSKLRREHSNQNILPVESETTNKVLLVGGIIAGLIGLNKLFGK